MFNECKFYVVLLIVTLHVRTKACPARPGLGPRQARGFFSAPTLPRTSLLSLIPVRPPLSLLISDSVFILTIFFIYTTLSFYTHHLYKPYHRIIARLSPQILTLSAARQPPNTPAHETPS